MDNEVDTAAGSASADHSDAQKDEAQISQEPGKQCDPVHV